MRKGWTWSDTPGGLPVAVHESGAIIRDDETGWAWEIGYTIPATRHEPADWMPVHEGWAPTFRAAAASVEWIVAVEEEYERKAEAQIEEAMLGAEQDRIEYERRERAGEFS